jgi:hypothetical protein
VDIEVFDNWWELLRPRGDDCDNSLTQLEWSARFDSSQQFGDPDTNETIWALCIGFDLEYHQVFALALAVKDSEAGVYERVGLISVTGILPPDVLSEVDQVQAADGFDPEHAVAKSAETWPQEIAHPINEWALRALNSSRKTVIII